MTLSTFDQAALDALASDLERIFGARLQSIAAYGLDNRASDAAQTLHTLVLVERLTFADLTACVPLTPDWRARNLAVPLILPREEFLRTLDVFPLEYGDIIANHVVVTGSDPFVGVSVAEADFRRAIEWQAKSHLIHLREGFLETQGRPEAVAQLVAASVPAYRALLRNIERLETPDGDASEHTQPSRRLLQQLSTESAIADPTVSLERYMADVERIWRNVDAWRR